jgi:hypothetical protein
MARSAAVSSPLIARSPPVFVERNGIVIPPRFQPRFARPVECRVGPQSKFFDLKNGFGRDFWRPPRHERGAASLLPEYRAISHFSPEHITELRDAVRGLE